MSFRLVLTAITIVLFLILGNIYSAFAPAVEATAAVQQVKDSAVTYTYGREMARGNLVPLVLRSFTILSLVAIWIGPVVRRLKKSSDKNSAASLLVITGLTSLLGACGPAKVLPLETVGPNETAFVIPMEGDSTDQAKFESIDFLKAHKVMSKRIEMPVRSRSTGRMWWDYEWLPTVRVIKVDRSLVTREWTSDGDKGTGTGKDNKNEALSVASLDGVNFHLGVNLTASILEEDAATYLYFHGQKPLSEVVDSNVRGFLQGMAADEFGRINLEEGKRQKADLFAKANLAAIAKFKQVGITLSYVGSAEGFKYDDPSIQDQINRTQTAEMAIEVARKKVQEQEQLNLASVSKAVADRRAAEEFAKAAEAQASKTALDIEMVKAQAQLEMAKNLKDLKGQLPSVLPQGSMFLFGGDGVVSKRPQ